MPTRSESFEGVQKVEEKKDIETYNSETGDDDTSFRLVEECLEVTKETIKDQKTEQKAVKPVIKRMKEYI